MGPMALLAAFAPGRPAVAPAPTGLDRFWVWFSVWGRGALLLIGAALLIWLMIKGWRRLSRSGRRGVLWASTATALIAFAVLSMWTLRLPQPRGSVFILWHQFVRIGAVLSGVALLFLCMALLLPKVLNRIELRGFIPFVAVRHVRAQKSGFLTVISGLSIAGVGLACFALCLVTSIMGGFGSDLKRKILGNNAHLRIESTRVGGFSDWQPLLERVRRVPGVAAATPVAAGEVMASSSSNTAGVLVRGVDTATIARVIDVVSNVEVGKFAYLDQPKRLANLPADEPVGVGPGGEIYLKGLDYQSRIGTTKDAADDMPVPEQDIFPGVVLGRELAKSLHVFVGDEVTLVSPLGDLGPMGLLPRSRRFRVAAIFYSGMYEYDATYAYIRLDVAQEFLDLGHNVTAIEVRVPEPEAVRAVRDRVAAIVKRPDLRVRDWKELNRNLFNALLLEKITTFIILSISITVASFCIICTLLLMVTEKSKEIAILKSLGASDRHIQRLFMMEGMIIGVIGTIFGVITGWAAAKGIQSYGVRLSPEVYYVDRLPIEVNWSDYVLVALAAFAITTLATVYPARAASRLRPVDGIRYE